MPTFGVNWLLFSEEISNFVRHVAKLFVQLNSPFLKSFFPFCGALEPWKHSKMYKNYQMSAEMSSLIREEVFADTIVWCKLVAF